MGIMYSPLVKIGLIDLLKTVGASVPPGPACDRPVDLLGAKEIEPFIG